MARRKAGSVPGLQHHRRSGQGRVHLSGRDFSCGTWGTPACKAAYDRLIAEWIHGSRAASRQAGARRGDRGHDPALAEGCCQLARQNRRVDADRRDRRRRHARRSTAWWWTRPSTACRARERSSCRPSRRNSSCGGSISGQSPDRAGQTSLECERLLEGERPREPRAARRPTQPERPRTGRRSHRLDDRARPGNELERVAGGIRARRT